MRISPDDAENPTTPDYDAADYLSGQYMEKTGVAPMLRAHAAKQMRDDVEVKKQLGKVRELRVNPRQAAQK